MRVRPKPEELAEIYIDESSQTNHRYLVIGGVVVESDRANELAAKISAARQPELPKNEAKWGKVSTKKLAAYKRIVDVLFDNPTLVHFHSVVIDTTKLDHRRFNEGSREIGFNKEIYQLAMKCARLYGDLLFHVYPDYRDTSQNPNDLRLILNRGCAKKGDRREWPFRRCQFRNSEETLPLQLTDVLIGSLAYRLNGHGAVAGASPPKIELSEYVLKKANIVDVFKDTAPAGTFTVWHRRLRERGVSQP
jgi:hypothetical protein